MLSVCRYTSWASTACQACFIMPILLCITTARPSGTALAKLRVYRFLRGRRTPSSWGEATRQVVATSITACAHQPWEAERPWSRGASRDIDAHVPHPRRPGRDATRHAGSPSRKRPDVDCRLPRRQRSHKKRADDGYCREETRYGAAELERGIGNGLSFWLVHPAVKTR